MDWESTLVALYLKICKEYESHIWVKCQRFTNGGYKKFSDEEVMSIYIFGILRGHRNIKSIHRYAQDHLRCYFPHLPSYQGFVHRLNRLPGAFQDFASTLQLEMILGGDDTVYLVDSFPIMLARNNHAYHAKVATELASKSYCATKKIYYHGVKAHVVARKRFGTLPDMEVVVIEEASTQDGPMFDQIAPMLNNNLVFGDKAYKRPNQKFLEQSQNLKIFTPAKKAQGQKKLPPQQRALSKAVSSIRQPIETLFGWLNKMTGIENASNVRSDLGLLAHIFGRMAAALVLKNTQSSTFDSHIYSS